jgi:hypothetical protein
METLIGFVAGYKDRPDGVRWLRSAARTSGTPARSSGWRGEAMSFAEVLTRQVLAGRGASGRGLGGLSGAVGSVTDALAWHTAAAR